MNHPKSATVLGEKAIFLGDKISVLIADKAFNSLQIKDLCIFSLIVLGECLVLESVNQFDRLIYEEWFGLFPYHIRAQLNSKAEVHTYKVGDPVFQKGEDGPWLAAIMSGRVRISLQSFDGREMLISMVERGEVCGERAVFDGMPRSSDAFAEEDTTCLIFKREDLLPVMYSCPDTMMYVIKILGNRVVRYLNTMELYAMQSMPTRLANFLVFLGQKYGCEEGGRLVLPINLSQTDLSQQIASSRESINRQMRVFAEQGLVSLEDGEIVITDLAGLEKICHIAVSD